MPPTRFPIWPPHRHIGPVTDKFCWRHREGVLNPVPQLPVLIATAIDVGLDSPSVVRIIKTTTAHSGARGRTRTYRIDLLLRQGTLPEFVYTGIGAQLRTRTENLLSLNQAPLPFWPAGHLVKGVGFEPTLFTAGDRVYSAAQHRHRCRPSGKTMRSVIQA